MSDKCMLIPIILESWIPVWSLIIYTSEKRKKNYYYFSRDKTYMHYVP